MKGQDAMVVRDEQGNILRPRPEEWQAADVGVKEERVVDANEKIPKVCRIEAGAKLARDEGGSSRDDTDQIASSRYYPPAPGG